MMTNKPNKFLTPIDISTTDQAFRHLRKLSRSESEELWVLALGPRKTLIRSKMIFRGTVDSCLVHPRDIFRFACLQNASSIMIAHNHPSGELKPSYDDLRFTEQLIRASALMEIPLVDHLIVTRQGYTSLKTEAWIEFHNEDDFVTRHLNEEDYSS